MLRRTLLAAAALAPLATPARAADPEAVAPIQALNTALLNAMRAGKSQPFPTRFATLAPVVERAFDIPATLQSAVGPRWSSIPAPQQAQLLDVFRKFTVARYVDNFDEFNGEKLEVLGDSRSVGTDQVVATRIVPSNGEPVRIDYVMRRSASGWRAVDVLLNASISQVAVQRSDFRALIASGDASALIQNLQRKVAELSGGTMS